MKANKRGVSLIIVIFAMMLFAVLGWTLAVMQTTDFQANLRNLDSERALGLAEAGAQWGMRALKDSAFFDCSSFNPTGNPAGIRHTLGFGQYRTSCTCTDSPPQCNNSSQLILVSKGYIPSEANFRAERQIRLLVDQGALSRAGTVKNLFDWSQAHANTDIDGDLTAKNFNRNSTSPYNEAADLAVPGDGERIPTDPSEPTIPPIDMSYLETKAQGYGKRVDYSSTVQASNGSGGTTLKVLQNNYFTGKEGEAVRNLTHGTWNYNDWAVIVSVPANKNGKEAELDRDIGVTAWDDDYIRIVKRFSGNLNNDKLWYVKGSDIIIDVSANNCSLQHTSLVAEGSSGLADSGILIYGPKFLTMKSYIDNSANETYPNLSTQNGSIISASVPEGSNESQKCNNRSFDGLIYSQNGDVRMNYINGVAVIGNNVYFDGLVKLYYMPKFVASDAFWAAVSIASWKEQ